MSDIVSFLHIVYKQISILTTMKLMHARTRCATHSRMRNTRRVTTLSSG
jgi:hypothetical protein